jgi:hypothetical protein
MPGERSKDDDDCVCACGRFEAPLLAAERIEGSPCLVYTGDGRPKKRSSAQSNPDRHVRGRIRTAEAVPEVVLHVVREEGNELNSLERLIGRVPAGALDEHVVLERGRLVVKERLGREALKNVDVERKRALVAGLGALETIRSGS